MKKIKNEMGINLKHFKLLFTLIFFVIAAPIFNTGMSQLTDEVWCMEFVDDQTGIALGDNGTIRHTTNGGINWVTKISGTSNTLKKTEILTDDEIVAVGLSGTIIKTTDQGNSWSTKVSGTSSDLYSISFGGRDNEVGIAVGLNGVVIRTTDQGESWVQWNSADTTLRDINYTAVSFANENKGIIVGDNGIILVTEDGGVTWGICSTILSPVNYKFITMLTDELAYVTGENGTIIKTTDGGESWETISAGVTNTLYRIRFVDDQIALTVGTGGTVLKTTNGGSNWSTESSGTTNNLNCLFVVDENIAYSGGGVGIILKTTDGGVNWVFQGEGEGDSRFSDTPKENTGVFFTYPNPSNPVTTVKYYIPEMSKVSMEVFDVTGKMINTLVNETKEKGLYSVVFNGSSFASGTYFCKLVTSSSTGITTKTMKIILVK